LIRWKSWKDGSESEIDGKDLKESHPGALDNYAIQENISNDKAFA